MCKFLVKLSIVRDLIIFFQNSVDWEHMIKCIPINKSNVEFYKKINILSLSKLFEKTENSIYTYTLVYLTNEPYLRTIKEIKFLLQQNSYLYSKILYLDDYIFNNYPNLIDFSTVSDNPFLNISDNVLMEHHHKLNLYKYTQHHCIPLELLKDNIEKIDLYKYTKVCDKHLEYIKENHKDKLQKDIKKYFADVK